MKVKIHKDERWPDYGMYKSELGEQYNQEISDELYARYMKINSDYDALQNELEKLYKEASWKQHLQHSA